MLCKPTPKRLLSREFPLRSCANTRTVSPMRSSVCALRCVAFRASISVLSSDVCARSRVQSTSLLTLFKESANDSNDSYADCAPLGGVAVVGGRRDNAEHASRRGGTRARKQERQETQKRQEEESRQASGQHQGHSRHRDAGFQRAGDTSA